MIFKRQDEPCEFDPDVWLENETYPLRIESTLVVSDLAPLMAWQDDGAWTPVDEFAAGDYGVAVRLYGRGPAHEPGRQQGYIIDLTPQDALPPLTADLEEFLQH